MKAKVVITHWVHPEVIEFLEKEVVVVPNLTRSTLTREEILFRAKDAHAIMAFMPDAVDATFLENCPQLRIIAAALKGFDNFDVEACTRHNVWLTIAPDLLTVPTAELTITLMLGLARHVLAGDRHVRSGLFKGWRPELYGKGLAGSTAGIIGMGLLGRAVAKRLNAFDMNVLYVDEVAPTPEEEARLGICRTTLEKLLSESDFVLPLLPYTEQTHYLINHERLGQMKPGALLVNTGRGSVVDETAVLAALESGHLGGYAADVYEMEDWLRPDRPVRISSALLAKDDKTLFTPHIGSAVQDIRLQIELYCAQSILQALSGKQPQGVVNQVMPPALSITA